MGYVVEREGRWYAVGIRGIAPDHGADQRQWHRASTEAESYTLAAELPARARRDRAHGLTLARFVLTQ